MAETVIHLFTVEYVCTTMTRSDRLFS